MQSIASARKYVPADLDCSDFAKIEPILLELHGRPLRSTSDVEAWLADLSELQAVLDEYAARRYIARSCDTEDEGVKRAYLHWVENVEPRLKPHYFEMQKKLVGSPHRDGLDPARFRVLLRNWASDVEIFREENVPLETQVTRIVTEYDEMCGAMTVRIGEAEYTLQQAARFLEETDRAVREEAWRKISARRLQDRDKADSLFGTLLDLRAAIGRASCRERV